MEKLMQLPLFREQEKKVLTRLIKILQEKKYPAGAEIFSEDSIGETLYIILSGEVLITKIINKKTGEKKPLAILGQGDFFGEMSLLEDKPRSASASAKTEVELLLLPRKEFQTLLHSEPEIAATYLFALNNQLSARLRRTSQELTLLFETGRIIGQGKSLNEMCNLLLERLLEGIPQSEAGFFALENEYTDEYEIIAAQGLSEDLIQPLPPEEPLIAYFLNRIKTSSIGLNEDYVFFEEQVLSSSRLKNYVAQSILALPLVDKNELLGIIILLNFKEQHIFKKEDWQLLSAVGSQIVPAIQITRYHEEEKARERLARARERVV
ncbi:MAG TPA: hypothetical protein DHV62_00880 [Elusimicrobia bacterium]|nr:hypothetical protein [Elusimicrobiota bacterium]